MMTEMPTAWVLWGSNIPGEIMSVLRTHQLCLRFAMFFIETLGLCALMQMLLQCRAQCIDVHFHPLRFNAV